MKSVPLVLCLVYLLVLSNIVKLMKCCKWRTYLELSIRASLTFLAEILCMPCIYVVACKLSGRSKVSDYDYLGYIVLII